MDHYLEEISKVVHKDDVWDILNRAEEDESISVSQFTYIADKIREKYDCLASDENK